MHHPPSIAAVAVHVAISSVSVFVVAKLLPGVKVKSLGAALAFSVVVAALNVAAWHLLSHNNISPGQWMARGAGGFVMNGIVFAIAARIVGGVKVSGCIMAAIAAFCVTFVNHVIHGFVAPYLP